MTGTGGLVMDYQEAIELLKGEIKCSCYRNRGYCGICTIYSELERDKIIDACKCAISAMQELQEYKQLGTLEEVMEAVERQQAISREIIEGKYFCPKCHNLMPYPGYCGCGQKLY